MLKADDPSEDERNISMDSATMAAQLLGMDEDSLVKTIKRRKVAVPGRKSTHEVPRTATQARHILHSLIKALYKRLFDSMVKRINESFRELQPTGTAADL